MMCLSVFICAFKLGANSLLLPNKMFRSGTGMAFRCPRLQEDRVLSAHHQTLAEDVGRHPSLALIYTSALT
jgi:hypothetical protein